MSTAPSALQQDLAAVEQIGIAATEPFIKSAAGQAQVGTVASEINLGIAALPALIDLFKSFAGLLSHVHVAATATSTAAPVPAKV